MAYIERTPMEPQMHSLTGYGFFADLVTCALFGTFWFAALALAI